MVAAQQILAKPEPKSSLGIDRKIRVPLPTVPAARTDESPTEYRFRLQRYARSCYGNHDHRLDQCCVTPTPGSWGVDVVRNPAHESAHFVNLVQCSRVWTCPVCAARISNLRRRELSQSLAVALKKGYTPVLVTFTLSHSYRDLLEYLIDRLKASMREFKSGRAYQTIKSEFGILGAVAATEITFGENGWHPHIHQLIFLDLERSKLNIHAFKKWLADRWLAVLEKHDMHASFEHGLDVKTADSEIAEYIAKWGHEPKEYGWSPEHEITRNTSKKAHADGLTPFQLLECAGAGDARARVLFQEYARCMEGKRQLTWSPGLRALLELPDELPDEQLPLFEDEPQSYTIAEFSKEEWRRCAIYELQPIILQLCAAGATAALRAVLRQRDIKAMIYDPPAADDPPSNMDLAQISGLPGADEICEQLTLVEVPVEKKKWQMPI